MSPAVRRLGTDEAALLISTRCGSRQGNAGGAALYAAAGFADTGRREPLGHSDAVVAVLERLLGER